MSNILSIHGLHKHYGRIVALHPLHLEIKAGHIYGLLGPNGSGKTTTLGITLGITRASGGTYRWFGETPRAVQRQRIGSLLETPNFYPYLSALRNLEIVATLKGQGQTRINEVLTHTGLYARRHAPVHTYSLGMRQRLALASALLVDPEVLILDEPTNGLDPQGIADVRQLIQSTAEQGKTIILASHILDEVEKICSHVAVLKQGHLIANGEISQVLTTGHHLLLQSDNPSQLAGLLPHLPGYQRHEQTPEFFRLWLKDVPLSNAEINRYCFAQGVTLTHLQWVKPSLEETFLTLMQETLHG